MNKIKNQLFNLLIILFLIIYLFILKDNDTAIYKIYKNEEKNYYYIVDKYGEKINIIGEQTLQKLLFDCTPPPPTINNIEEMPKK